jgi:tetratricopeptide (TPR) repeat protein
VSGYFCQTAKGETNNHNQIQLFMIKPTQVPFSNKSSLPGSVIALLVFFFQVQANAQQATDPLPSLIFETAQLNSSTALPSSSARPLENDLPIVPEPAASEFIETEGNAELRSASLTEYRAAISSSIDTGNQYSQALSEQYEALGILLYQEGSFEEAVEAFDKAIHIKKVNLGLFNLDQSRLVDYLIRTQIALGDFVSVDNHKHYLYYLQEKNLAKDDPRLLTAKLDWADWNIEAFVKGYRDIYIYPIALTDSIDAGRSMSNRIQFNVPVNRDPVDNSSISSPGVSSGETNNQTIPVTINVPMLNSNSVATNAAITDYNLRSVPFALSNDVIVNQRLHEAEEIYESILEQLEKNSSNTLIQQQAIQYKLANINYLLKKELDPLENISERGSIAYNRVNQQYTSDADLLISRRYVSSKNSLTNLVEKIETSAENSSVEKANAYISLGDMHLSFERSQRAFQAYSKAYNLLLADGYSSADADMFISPTPVIAVPAYGIHNYSRKFFGISEDTEIPYKGYIDVSFSKDRFGNIKTINIVGSSQETNAKIQSALIDHLRTQRFRPLINNGESIAQSDLNLRYHYYY